MYSKKQALAEITAIKAELDKRTLNDKNVMSVSFIISKKGYFNLRQRDACILYCLGVLIQDDVVDIDEHDAYPYWRAIDFLKELKFVDGAVLSAGVCTYWGLEQVLCRSSIQRNCTYSVDIAKGIVRYLLGLIKLSTLKRYLSDLHI